MTVRLYYVVFIFLPLLFFALRASSQTEFNQYNLIQNGTFDLSDYGWLQQGLFVQRSEQAAFDTGGFGIDLNPESFDSSLGYIAQQVPFLPGFTSATLTFEYRFYGTGQAQQLGEFGVGLLTGADPVNNQAIVVFEQTNDPSNLPVLEWREFTYEFTEADLSALRSHLDAGGTATFVCYLFAQGIAMHIDEIKLTADAAFPAPDAPGTIAYIQQVDTNRRAIGLTKPAGSGKRTLFEPPNPLDDIYDLAWRPDAGELAFTSNYEAAYSPYSQDIFAIKPDGSGLRRITNYPSVRELLPETPTGSVTGSIRNDTLRVVSIAIYIQGAPALQSYTVGIRDTVDFTIDGIADLGEQALHTVALAYDADYREIVPVALDIIPGETVDIGEILFLDRRFRLNPFHISWNATSENIAFDMGGLLQTITAFPTEPTVSTELLGSIAASAPELSPVDGRILYTTGLDLQLYNPTTDSSRKLAGGNLIQGHAWLPDASGILYSNNLGTSGHIVEYNLSSGQSIQRTMLTNETTAHPSPSWPDARYIAFTRGSSDSSIQNIWVMERERPGYMWPITDDGGSYNPMWSRVDVPEDTTIQRWYNY